MWWTRNDIREGMFVTSVAGQRLGKVISCDADTFIIEKGVFFPKDFELRYDHITDVSDAQITYLLSDEYAMQGIQPQPKAKAARTAGTATGTIAAAAHGLKSVMRGAKEGVTERGRGPREDIRGAREDDMVEREYGAREDMGMGAREDLVERERGAKVELREHELDAQTMPGEKEIRIPLLAEEMDVEKVDRETGHVRIHKAVKTEERRVTVPLRREEITIEHVAASIREGEVSADGAYREQTVDIPLHEEELLIGKHSIVREEVIVRTIAQSVDREAIASLRSEDLQIEDSRPLPKVKRETGFGAPGAASTR